MAEEQTIRKKLSWQEIQGKKSVWLKSVAPGY